MCAILGSPGCSTIARNNSWSRRCTIVPIIFRFRLRVFKRAAGVITHGRYIRMRNEIGVRECNARNVREPCVSLCARINICILSRGHDRRRVGSNFRTSLLGRAHHQGLLPGAAQRVYPIARPSIRAWRILRRGFVMTARAVGSVGLAS